MTGFVVFYVVVIMTLSVTMFNYAPRSASSIAQQSSQSQKHDERRGSINWFVKRAKERNETRVLVPPPEESYAEVQSLEDAILRYSTLIVEPIEQHTVVWDGATIVTWNKLKVIDYISYPIQNYAQCTNGLTAPSEMLPLSVGEILVPIYGGSLTIDGVQLESRNLEFGSHFSLSKQYLVFLSLDHARSVGQLSLGPHGVFILNSLQQTIPILDSKSMLSRELDVKAGNSLHKFKDHVHRGRSNL